MNSELVEGIAFALDVVKDAVTAARTKGNQSMVDQLMRAANELIVAKRQATGGLS